MKKGLDKRERKKVLLEIRDFVYGTGPKSKAAALRKVSDNCAEACQRRLYWKIS
jgi:hypothetical protein